MNSDNRRELKRALCSFYVFDDAPPPRFVRTSGSGDPEFLAVTDYFKDRRWNSVSVHSMKEIGILDITIICCVLESILIAYYLPGLLLLTLDEEWYADELAGHLVSFLSKAGDAEREILRRSLSPQQREFTKTVLRAVCESWIPNPKELDAALRALD
jgi:hypothetical protein